MSLYGHYTLDELKALRTRLLASLHDRLTAPTQAGGNGRSVAFNQDPAAIEAQLVKINAEIARREGTTAPGPIYLV